MIQEWTVRWQQDDNINRRRIIFDEETALQFFEGLEYPASLRKHDFTGIKLLLTKQGSEDGEGLITKSPTDYGTENID